MITQNGMSEGTNSVHSVPSVVQKFQISPTFPHLLAIDRRRFKA